MFISFEGIDGAGKSTAFERLKKEILASADKDKFIFTREPGGTKISEAIRQILISTEYETMDPWTEAFLYAAARRQNMVERIAPALKKGQIVFADRYVDSSLAYQGSGRKLGLKSVAEINRFAIDKAIPDKVIYFKISPEVALKRVNQRVKANDRFEKEQTSFFIAITEGYEELISQNPNRYIIIDAQKSPEKVYTQVKMIIEQLIKETFN